MSWFRKRPAPGEGPLTDSSVGETGVWVRADKTRRLVRRHTPLGDIPTNQMSGATTGSLLEAFAQWIVYNAIKIRGRPLMPVDRVVRIGSACSGSEMLSVAVDALAAELQNQHIKVTFEVVFTCEIDKDKRTWCMDVQSRLQKGLRMPCCFHDVAGFEGGWGKCARHEASCRLPESLDGFVAGFSCKDFSRANPNKKALSRENVFQQLTTPGKSADTMHGVLDVLGVCMPDWLLLENVDSMDEGGHSSAHDCFLSELGSHGYDCRSILLDAQEYGLPQSRKRLFILGVLRPARHLQIADYSKFFKRFLDLLSKFKAMPPCLTDSMLLDDDEYLAKASGELSENSKGWDSSTMEVHRSEWNKRGLRFQTRKPHPADQDSAWYAALAARHRDCLAFRQHTVKSTTATDMAKLVGTDVGQDIRRLPHTTLGVAGKITAPTLLPNTMLWISVEAGGVLGATRSIHRPLLGAEALAIQGWPIFSVKWSNMLSDYSDRFLGNLAGNAFPGTVIAAIINALVFSIDSADTNDGSSTTRGACDEALTLLSEVASSSSQAVRGEAQR